MQAFNWNDLRYVLAVARFQTLAQAARRLGVNETTVARRIGHAEQALGVRLFDRVPGMLRPTEAGEVVAARAERVEQEVDAAVRATMGADAAVAGTVRLTSVPIVVNRILIPALPAFAASHPLLRLELIADPRDLSLSKRETDMALRLARPRRDLRALARRVGQLDYAVFAPSGHDGDRLPWITYDDAMADLPQARWIAERMKGRKDDAPVVVNDAEAMVQAVKAGLGKSLLPILIGDREPGLSRLDGPSPALSRELWLLTHAELRELRRVQVVAEWVCSIVRAPG